MSTLVDTLLSEGLITAERLEEAEARAAASYTPLASVLMQQGIVEESSLLRVMDK
jgi:hypothetical protein